MARSGASKLARVAHRGLQSTRIARTATPSFAASPVVLQYAPSAAPASVFTASRHLSTTPHRLQSITPDAKAPKNAEATPVTKTPADISDGEYHAVADEYLDKLVMRLEQLQDEQEEVDVEFAVRMPTQNTCDPPNQSSLLCCTSKLTLTPSPGWRPHPQPRPRDRHVRDQQATA